MHVSDQPLWDIDAVSKAYPGVQANDRVSIQLMPGRIHGLLGENGSGKSTLIRLLSGVDRPDSGEIRLKGRAVSMASPTEARALGVATVFQEFSIVPSLTVAENVFLGRWPRRAFGLIDWDTMNSRSRDVLAELDIELDPEAVTSTLSVAQQQLIEIAKAVAAEAQLIILDEPTTALGLDEIAQLHALLRRMRDKGHAILYVSHRLDEVTALVDEVTIMRGGRVVSAAGNTAVQVDAIVSAMIGGDVREHYPKICNVTSEVVLDVSGMSSAKGARDVSFTLHKGEVLGLGGVLGSGRTEIARALFGLDPIVAGTVVVRGRRLQARSPADAIAAGLALVTENRKTDGLFFNFDGRSNISSASLSRFSHFGFLDLKREERESARLAQLLELSRGAEDKSVRHLSGGNQQKVVLARWLLSETRVLILDEPTQGIDIGAKLAVYRLINQLTAQGCAILLISSDHDELLAMSDRIAVIRQGSVTDIRAPNELSHADLVRAATGEDTIQGRKVA
ncbi:sugar ABC transporter ATP-binding protein [Kaistia dalseonensis]|uniref:ABC-type sugar transport system ATPase subunit n=1 Tax=Kaistia dalseonensis TaxID=410840 RepID=A0ABU0H422_9HYPH|nr:sugar ABC transporter ATP-binding protein [Kaistia dalseonensis]MCX5494463.1 sugar ABC transporter ATP-binding protein [Kaistia dalseonensis]MDQ0437042.1 ABC-type sugar transport system ATPase subunit [Kaistia dalseonensis]